MTCKFLTLGGTLEKKLISDLYNKILLDESFVTKNRLIFSIYLPISRKSLTIKVFIKSVFKL